MEAQFQTQQTFRGYKPGQGHRNNGGAASGPRWWRCRC